jgi:hypothetical protein
MPGYSFVEWTVELAMTPFGSSVTSPAALEIGTFNAPTITFPTHPTEASFPMPDGPVIVRARWNVVETRTVTFNLNGGTVGGNPAPITRTVNNGGTVTGIPAPQFPVLGGMNRNFVIWVPETPGATFTNVTQDMTFTAMWRVANRRIGEIMPVTPPAIINRTSRDAVMIARWIVAPPDVRQTMIAAGFCEYSADINGDGRVTLDDLIIFQRWLVGLDVSQWLIVDSNGNATRVSSIYP